MSTAQKTFQDASRSQQSLLAPAERRCLLWLARHTPTWIHSDHLTLLGFLAMAVAGVTYAAASRWAPALLVVNLWIAVNWLGDSLDGTLARVRNKLRPRYGFYVDHMVDAFGTLFLLAGLALSGYMSVWVALGLLLGYLLLSIDAYLATYALGTFHLSFWKFSPTEMRILLAAGNVVAFFRPHVFGSRYLFFDAGGSIAILAMAVVLVISVGRNARTLYLAERV